MPIYDISLTISPSLVVWPGDPPVSMAQTMHMDRGDDLTVTRLDMGAHVGTHVDAPVHFVAGGAGADTLSLDVLVGPALLVEAPQAEALSAEVLGRLSIPVDTERLLVRTRNSEFWARGETQFDASFVAVTTDGARWLIDHGVRLIGVDYLSVAPWDDLYTPHRILLNAGLIPLEGLNLASITPGQYQLICLPLKLAGSDGAPARAILIG